MLVMFVRKLAEFVEAEDVVVNIVNPSAVYGTEIMRDVGGKNQAIMFVRIWMIFLFILFARSLRDGARQYVYASVVLGRDSHGSFVDRIIRPSVLAKRSLNV